MHHLDRPSGPSLPVSIMIMTSNARLRSESPRQATWTVIMMALELAWATLTQ